MHGWEIPLFPAKGQSHFEMLVQVICGAWGGAITKNLNQNAGDFYENQNI
jgi:hypothetical protein